MESGKFIKNFALFALLFCFGVSASFTQTRNPAQNPAPKKPAASPQTIVKTTTEISADEWTKIVDAFDKEDWMRAVLLAQMALGRLKNDNDKKQLAQLRYFYLYALAGKAAGGQIAYAELENTARSFIGKEFLMPSRQFLSNCTAKVNYICPVSDNEKALRVTATNKTGSAIHSFEYVKFNEKIDISGNDGKEAFIGGTLQAAQVNLYKQNIRILRLIFDKGSANIVANR
jgi:hypothetical protein